ncbi:restriction endonuclease [Caproicibacterium sp. NSD3]
MQDRITFQFDDKLDYQKKAVDSVVDLFRGLPKKASGFYSNLSRAKKLDEGNPVRNIEIVGGTRLLENLRSVQLRNGLFEDDEIKGNNFTIEMETGTGKTYVYLRTILELNQQYGFTKFMIVVPSIAIRKGVEKSIEMLSEHFKKLDYKDILKHSFVYDSKNLKNVSWNFVENKELSICIMNIQAFNKDTNKIRTEDEAGQNLWEDIKVIRPIIIIDEPQKIEGTKKKKSASLKALDELNPLFTLRYSATHKRLYNQVYKLDSYDAFQKDLVKKIEVKTVHGTVSKDFPYIRYVDFSDKALSAKIEIFSQTQGGKIQFKLFKVRGNASLYDLSGNLSQYWNYRVQEDPHKQKTLKIATPDGIVEFKIGQSNFEITQTEAVRIQIRLAIRSNIDKQIKVLEKGKKIKVLTLFFVDSVNKVRDNSATDGRGEYLRIFDEEYTKIIKESKYQNFFEEHKNLFPQYKDALSVREGYFAMDKNQKAVDIEDWDSSVNDTDVKVKAKSQEEIDRGIELILERKDELISFNEPLAFIFSHSALREGWDNPNIFTICALKNSGSEIAKKQEIGRGLRLPVDINGVQNRKETDLNELTIIANDSYEHFAAALQKDFNESMRFNKDEVTEDILKKVLYKAGINPDKITDELTSILKDELFYASIINTKNLLIGKPEQNAEKLDKIKFTNDTLHEHSIKIKQEFIKQMIEKGTQKIPIKNGDNGDVENYQYSYVNEGDFAEILRTLEQRLSKRTIYTTEIDKDTFIQSCIDDINAILKGRPVRNLYYVETGKEEFNSVQKMAMTKAKIKGIENIAQNEIHSKSDFELCNYIMYHTNLPRFAIFKILWGLEKKDLLSNQDILEFVVERIKDLLIDAKANSSQLSYDVINGYYFDSQTILEMDTIDEQMLNDAKKHVYTTNESKRKAINKYYHVDSDGEYDFAQWLEDNDNVLLFTKIKKGGFVIDTPYGNYSPDWAMVYRKGKSNLRLCFIVESKFEKKGRNLMEEEKLKIKCAKLHFKAVSQDIQFDWINSIDDFKTKFNVE